MRYSVSCELTNACNLRCATCLPASGRARPGELLPGRLLAILAALYDRGVESVLFTGGEPFFRRDFPDVLRACMTIGLNTSVISSGTIFGRQAIEVLRETGTRVSVSFDGATAETHDRVRGSGMFDRALAGTRKLAETGVPFDLSVTLSGHNLDEVEEMARLSMLVGARRVFFSEVSRGGRAADNWDWLAIDGDRRKTIPDLVAAAGRAVFGEDVFASDDHCWVTGTSLHLDSTGRAYLCSEIAQRAPDQSIARLDEPGGVERAMIRLDGERHGHRTCLYETFASEHVSLVQVHDRPCAVLALGAARIPFRRSERR